jgi:hypothetical protein
LKALISLVVAWAIMSIVIISCKKMQENGSTPPPKDSASTYLLDTTIFILKDTNLSTGVFHYSLSSQNLPDFKIGDCFIEPRNFGYLRKIDDIKKTNGDLYFYTEQATIFEAFKNYGDFNGTFSIPGAVNPFSYSSNQRRKSKTGPNSVTKSNGSSSTLSLFPQEIISVTDIDYFLEAEVNFNPVFRTFFSAQNKSFSLKIDSTILSLDFWVNPHRTSGGTSNRTDTLQLQNDLRTWYPQFFNRIPIEIAGPGGLPIVGDLECDLLAVVKYNGAQYTPYFQVFAKRQFAMSINYQNANLDASFTYRASNDKDLFGSQIADNTDLVTAMYLIPVFKINFYNVPVTKISLLGKMTATVENNSIPNSWIEFGQFGVQGATDFYNKVFGYFPNTVTSIISTEINDTVYKAPGMIISTGEVSGKPGDNIPMSIEIQDSHGSPILFPTTIYYSSDIGSWDNPVLVSSSVTGTATNNFTLAAGTNNVQITVKGPDNRILASLRKAFVTDNADVGFNKSLVGIGPYPIPGLVPGFNGSLGSVYVAGGSIHFNKEGDSSFYVKIFDANNAYLYTGNASVSSYGDESPNTTFVQTDQNYPGASPFDPNRPINWGVTLPPGSEIFFNIGGSSSVGMKTPDGRYAMVLPVGYSIFQ